MGKQQEVIDKLKALLAKRYGAVTPATMEQLFRDYADPEGLLGSKQISRVLEDAGIGNFLTRPMYVSGVLGAATGSPTGRLSWPQLVQLVQKHGPLDA